MCEQYTQAHNEPAYHTPQHNFTINRLSSVYTQIGDIIQSIMMLTITCEIALHSKILLHQIPRAIYNSQQTFSIQFIL